MKVVDIRLYARSKQNKQIVRKTKNITKYHQNINIGMYIC